MRVLHVIGSLGMGGSQTMVMSIYRAINREKVQFDFIVDCDTNFFAEEIQKLGGKVFRLPKFLGWNYLQVCSAWATFFKEHPEYKVLHSHVRSYASIYLPIAKAHGLKTIIHSHNTSNGKGVKAIVKRIWQYPLRYQADYFFGCSEIAGRWLFGEKVVRTDRYFMLKNAVDTERFSYCQENRERIRKELAVDDDTLLLGHVGRMFPQKNHRFLLDCFHKIVKQKDNVKLMLLGDGELRGELRQQMQRLGLEDKVLMLGVRSNVEEYFSAMDCLVFPSLYEGLPVVIVEAQANGLQCLVSDTVTKEVCLSELVEYLPIDQGEEPWVNAVMNCVQHHTDVSDKIQKHGFCVKTSSAWLCDFYLSIVN